MEIRDYLERCFVIMAIFAWAAMMFAGLVWLAKTI